MKNGFTLTLLVEVGEDVLLRLELPLELLRLHHAEGALLALLVVVAFHIAIEQLIVRLFFLSRASTYIARPRCQIVRDFVCGKNLRRFSNCSFSSARFYCSK